MVTPRWNSLIIFIHNFLYNRVEPIYKRFVQVKIYIDFWYQNSLFRTRVPNLNRMSLTLKVMDGGQQRLMRKKPAGPFVVTDGSMGYMAMDKGLSAPERSKTYVFRKLLENYFIFLYTFFP